MKTLTTELLQLGQSLLQLITLIINLPHICSKKDNLNSINFASTNNRSGLLTFALLVANGCKINNCMENISLLSLTLKQKSTSCNNNNLSLLVLTLFYSFLVEKIKFLTFIFFIILLDAIHNHVWSRPMWIR